MPSKDYGILARFETPKTLLEATKKVRDSGYKNIIKHLPQNW